MTNCPHCGGGKFLSTAIELKNEDGLTVGWENTCKNCGQVSVYVEETEEQVTVETWQQLQLQQITQG